MPGSPQQLEILHLNGISQLHLAGSPQLEEIPQLAGSLQQVEISQPEETQLLSGNPQLAEIPQHGRAQLR